MLPPYGCVQKECKCGHFKQVLSFVILHSNSTSNKASFTKKKWGSCIETNFLRAIKLQPLLLALLGKLLMIATLHIAKIWSCALFLHASVYHAFGREGASIFQSTVDSSESSVLRRAREHHSSHLSVLPSKFVVPLGSFRCGDSDLSLDRGI